MEVLDEENSFSMPAKRGANKHSDELRGPQWAAQAVEPNPMDESLPEVTITSKAFNTRDSERQRVESSADCPDEELMEELARTCFQGSNFFNTKTTKKDTEMQETSETFVKCV